MARPTHSLTFVAVALFAAAIPACTCGLVGQGGACKTAQDCDYGLACAGNGACEPPGFDGGSAHVTGGCVNLQCQQVHCAPDAGTTLTGHVYDPSGTVPLYNAIVYVPNGAVQPFPQGLTCDRCGTFASGSPLVTTLTGPDGAFTLKDVPVGKDIPLVLQIGKWRRQVTVPAVSACQRQGLTDVNQQRLPRSAAEGDLPRMAIATGSADPMECLLLKLGIDPAEFTVPGQGGHIHMYTQNGAQLAGGSPPASALWSDAGTLAGYDLVLFPCEGAENPKPAAATQNVVDYASSGGRLFATHYSYVWTAFAPQPFPATADWQPDKVQAHDPPDPFAVTVDQSFPKGVAFAEWLGNVQALDGGVLELTQARQDVVGVNPDAGTSRWLWAVNPVNSVESVQHLTFNTPVFPPALPDGGAGLQCGRVVFSDFHVVADAGTGSATFPASCASGPLTPQEKALVFMLFDVSACIQSDTQVPSVCAAAGKACAADTPCCSGLACENAQFNACAPGEACTCEPTVQ